MKHNLFIIISMSLFTTFSISSCDQEDYPYYILSECAGFNNDIPKDLSASSAPTTVLNNIIPNAQFSRSTCNRLKINMIGIIDPVLNTTIEFESNKNLFVTEDGVLQGIKVTQVGGETTLNFDIVFVIDNSGSMGTESDTIASKIGSFIEFLSSRGLNLKFGCVGYDGSVSGAINLTGGDSLKLYLNRPGYSGINRTEGFWGYDALRLNNLSSSFISYGENGIVAITFADSFFHWRNNASRVYINFTDEAIQPGGNSRWSVQGLKNRWQPKKGTVHTVYSLDYWIGLLPDTSKAYLNGTSSRSDWSDLLQRPWELSLITGGTIKFIRGDASDLDLTTLPVTGVLANSYLVEFVSSNSEAIHDVIITVKNGNTSDGKTIFSKMSYFPE